MNKFPATTSTSTAVAAENSSSSATTSIVPVVATETGVVVAAESSSPSATTGIGFDIFSDIDAFFSPTTSDDIFYSHLFSQASNASSEASSPYSSDTFGGDFRLQPEQSSYVQLYNSYSLSLASLEESLKKVDSLCRENEALRVANAELTRRISLLTHQTTIQKCILSESANLATELETHNLPKSISVRSRLRVKPEIVSENSTCPDSTRFHRAMDRAAEPQERVYLPSRRTEEEALEFKVYNQGMSKTELCNKWEETGACPYGDNCRFAHGIQELRPVIRHPRYKSAVCRMVLTRQNCPYGHRCHFRHNLTPDERLFASKSLNV